MVCGWLSMRSHVLAGSAPDPRRRGGNGRAGGRQEAGERRLEASVWKQGDKAELPPIHNKGGMEGGREGCFRSLCTYPSVSLPNRLLVGHVSVAAGVPSSECYCK